MKGDCQEGRTGDRASTCSMKVHARVRRAPVREESERRVDASIRHVRCTRTLLPDYTEPEPGQRPPKGASLRRKVKLPETM